MNINDRGGNIMTDRLAPLAHRIAALVDDITTAAENLVADGAHQDAADLEDEQSQLTALISPIDPDQGDPLDQADYNRALEVITILLNDAISFHLNLTMNPLPAPAFTLHSDDDNFCPSCSLPAAECLGYPHHSRA